MTRLHRPLTHTLLALAVVASSVAFASGHTPIASANTMATITATGCNAGGCGPWTPYPINVTGSGFRPNGTVYIDVYDQNATHLLSETHLTASSTGTINTNVSAPLPWAEYVQVHAGQFLVSSNVSQTFVYMSGQITATGGSMGMWITGDHFVPYAFVSIPVYGYTSAGQYTQLTTGSGSAAGDGTLHAWVPIAGWCPQYPSAQAVELVRLLGIGGMQAMGSNGATALMTC